MKKIVLSLAVLFSVAMVSCGGSKKAEATDSVDTTVAIEETVVETVDSLGDTTVAAEGEVAVAVDSAAK